MDDKTGAKPLQNLVAGLMILGMVACLGLIVHAGNEINRDLGPNAMAVSPDGRLFVASHGKVHVFTAEDRREASYDLAQMGAARIVADIGVRSDGRLLLADPEAARLRVCDLQRMACDGRDLGLASWTPAHLMPGNMFKFFLDEAGQRLYLSDNGGHTLVIADASGKVLSRTTASKEVIFPNQVVASVPGEITVADTNHYRIVTFEVSGDRVGKVVREFPTRGAPQSRPGRVAPFGLVRTADGGTWALLAREGMKDADVILFDAQGRPAKRMDLGAASDPFAIAAWKDAVLVADARNYRIHVFDPAGGNRRELRDPGFDAELRAIHARADAWRDYRTYAIFGIVVFPLVGLVVLWRLGVPLMPANRQPIPMPAAAAAPSAPLGPGITWLRPQPAFVDKQVKVLRTLFGFILLAIAGLAIFLAMIVSDKPLTMPRVVTFAALFIVALSIVVFMAMFLRGMRERMSSMGMGASAKGFHLSTPAWHGMGQALERGPFAWKDVFFDGRRIFAGGSTLMLKPPTGDEIFAREPFEREILARLPKSGYVSSAQLGWMAIKSLPFAAKLIYGLLFASVILVLLFRT